MNSYPFEHIRIWAVDPLDKVFRDSQMPEGAPKRVEIEAARGEVVSGQVALRVENIPLHGFGVDRVSVAPLRRVGRHTERGETVIPIQGRWVGYAFVPAPAWGVDASHLEGKAPGLYPDPLYDVYETHGNPHHFNPDHSIALAKDRTQALWLTIRVPRNAAPGVYEGKVFLHISFYGDQLCVPVRLHVWGARLPPRPTCGVENWFALAQVVRLHECGWWTPRFWELTRAYVRNLTDHRQTHLVVPMYELIEFRPAGRQGIRLDWRRFDRFVALALEAGITKLVGNHLATYTYHLGDARIHCGVHAFQRRQRVVRYQLLTPGSPEAAQWFAWFLPRLRQHLRDRGWLGRWWQHIRDEPCGIEAQYQAVYQALKRHAPELRTIDALPGPIVPACDCWVPSLDALGKNLEFFRQRQAAGDAVWTYVCCSPTGKYANRFTDQKTILPRLLFWIMARYGATGYLHWGYNWSESPVPEIDATYFVPAQGPVQSGDVCIVYPGPHGPRDSIRWEMQREGLQDYELLRLLAAPEPARAEAIAARLVRGFDNYELGTANFRAARHELLESASQLTARPSGTKRSKNV